MTFWYVHEIRREVVEYLNRVRNIRSHSVRRYGFKQIRQRPLVSIRPIIQISAAKCGFGGVSAVPRRCAEGPTHTFLLIQIPHISTPTYPNTFVRPAAGSCACGCLDYKCAIMKKRHLCIKSGRWPSTFNLPFSLIQHLLTSTRWLRRCV